MKIIHIIDSLGLGGAQTVVKGIFEAQKENKNIFLFSLRKRGVLTYICHPSVYIFPSRSRFSFGPLERLKGIIKEENIQILHCHLFRAQVFGYILKKLYFPYLTLIFHEHGEIFRGKLLFELFLKISEPCVDAYLAISGAVAQRFFQRKYIIKQKVQVLYNFVDSARFDKNRITWNINKARLGLGFEPEDFVVGFAGRIIPRKGWREFIRSGELVCRNFSKARFLIAGRGKDEGELARSIKNSKYSDRICFLGYVENMLWFYSMIDSLVVSSHWEPMGLTVLEAWASGVPVISSNTEALHEMVTDYESGLLFEPGNAQELAEKIQILYSDNSLRAELAKEGLKKNKEYSLEKYWEQLYSFYKQMNKLEAT